MHLGSPSVFGVTRFAHHFNFSVLCFCALFVLVLCLVFPMSLMSLNCPYLVAPSAFSTVYLWNTTFQLHVDFDRETPVWNRKPYKANWTQIRNIKNKIIEFYTDKSAKQGNLRHPRGVGDFPVLHFLPMFDFISHFCQ